MDPPDEVGQHFFAHLEVGDDAVPQGPYGLDVCRRAADHPLGLQAHGQGPTIADVDGYDRGLVQDDPTALQVDEGIGGTEVYCEASSEGREHSVADVGDASSHDAARVAPLG